MRKITIHTLLIFVAMWGSFLFRETPLAKYNLQTIALVFIIYVLIKKAVSQKTIFHLLDALVSVFIIGVVVNTTGGLASPFFFLYYFLIFTLALLLEPLISLSSTLLLVVLYLFQTPNNQNLFEYLPLFSLPFMTPLALFLGEQYRQAAFSAEKIKNDQFFLALVVRKHLQRLKGLADNFLGDHELTEIKKTLDKIDSAIREYEKNN